MKNIIWKMHKIQIIIYGSYAVPLSPTRTIYPFLKDLISWFAILQKHSLKIVRIRI